MRNAASGIFVVFFVSSCSSNKTCDPIAPPGVIAIVEGGAVDNDCEATVTATRGSETLDLNCAVNDGNCRCSGVEEAGTYDVELVWGTRQETQTVEVTEDECHLITEELSF